MEQPDSQPVKRTLGAKITLLIMALTALAYIVTLAVGIAQK